MDKKVDRDRRRIVRTLLIGAAAAPLAGASLVACSRGGKPSGSDSGDSDLIPGPYPSARSAPSKPIVYRARRDGILSDDGRRPTG